MTKRRHTDPSPTKSARRGCRGTQAIYLYEVGRLAAHHHRLPDQLTEEEVRAYLLGLRDRGVALGTFKTADGGIQFLYRRALDRNWPLFWKKRIRPPRQRRLPEVLSG